MLPPSTVEIVSEQIPRTVLPDPKPIKLEDVRFHVVKTGDICLVGDQYDTLSRNTAEILRWVREARWRLNWYRLDALPKDLEE
jgi:hypothetical protein